MAAPAGQEFMQKAAMSDMLEIESSQLALKSDNAKTKQFAQRMIKDHTATSTELKALVSEGKVKGALPPALDKVHQDKIAALAKLSGPELTKAYNAMQVAAHTEAVALFERYAKSGDNAALKAFAAKHLPHLQEHLKLAQALDK